MKKRIITLILAAVMLAALCAPALAASETWQTAYARIINENLDDYGVGIQLVDLDVDGTPELLIGGYPGSGLFSTDMAMYSFKNGAAVELTTNKLPGSDYYEDIVLSSGNWSDNNGAYKLYRNDVTGEWRIEGAYIIRAGYGSYGQYKCRYSLSGTKISCTPEFQQITDAGSTEYYVGANKSSESAYNKALAAANSGWTQVWSFECRELWDNGRPTDAEISELIDSYPAGPVLAQKSTHRMTVNGGPAAVTAYNINGNNYFKLRDVAAVLSGTGCRFSLGWDASARKITLTTGAAYEPVGGELAGIDALSRFGAPTDASLYADGALKALTAYNINGNNYYKLREVAELVGCSLEWDEANSAIQVTTD